jgi:hypothetical protein
MKSSISVNRSLASVLALASTAIFSMGGVAYAQNNTSGQGSSTAQSDTTKAGQQGPSSGATRAGQQGSGDPFPHDILDEPMQQGYVDQEKRAQRNKDPRSPSPDDHVPEFGRDKEGKPLKDPMYQQGGPIGPN